MPPFTTKPHPNCPYCQKKIVFPPMERNTDRRMVHEFTLDPLLKSYWYMDIICHGRFQDPPTEIYEFTIILDHGLPEGACIRGIFGNVPGKFDNQEQQTLLGCYTDPDEKGERMLKHSVFVGGTIATRLSSVRTPAQECMRERRITVPVAHIIISWTDLGGDLPK